MSHLTDSDLLEQIRGGNVDAFGHLVRRYQGLVFGVAFQTLGDIEDARDVSQDVFIRAFVRLDQLRHPGKLRAWLRQITLNESLAFASRRPRTSILDEVSRLGDETGETDARLLIAAALRAIDEQSRLTVILFYLHAYSLKEIGGFLDEPVTTIKSRLRNARAKLRKELEETLETNLGSAALPEDFAERVTRILEAVKKGDEKTTRALLEADSRLTGAREQPSTHTPLHIAAGSGNAALVELLLAYGADPNALEEGDNASALHFACERGRLDVVKLLVEAGSDVNWDLDIHLKGPLGWAVTFGTVHREIADYLIAHGAKLDMFSAIALGRIESVREMVEQEPVVLRQRMSKCERFQSPIEFATEQRQFEIAKLLVELGSEVSLFEAAGLGELELLASRLKEAPQQFRVNDALKAAVKAGQCEASRLLLQHGADANFAPQGTSLIFDAIGTNDEVMARLLIEHGADLEFKDRQWKATALGWQVFFGRVDQTRLALKLGSECGEHLIDLAKSGERGELRRFSAGSSEDYRRVLEVLWDVCAQPR